MAPTQESPPAGKPSMAPADLDVGPAPSSASAGGAPSNLSATPKFMKIAAYAARTGYSTRTIETFIGEGLPTVGERLLRRVDVEPADEWIRTQATRERDDQDAIIEEAREDARRAGPGPKRRRA
ncbi:MAG: hypothetical protein ACLQVI_43890 [Polyangiaceae bacterium]